MESSGSDYRIAQGKEELRKEEGQDKKIRERLDKVKVYLSDFFRREEKDISIEEKINFTAFIINNRNILIDLNDFYEEECQFAIINWVFANRKQLKTASNNLPVALLFNLIIILEIFPIKTTDFISLKIIEKLKSIKRCIKISCFEYAVRIQRMIAFWEDRIKEIDCLEKNQQFLNRKTARPGNINDSNNDIEISCKRRSCSNKYEIDAADSLSSASSALTCDDYSNNNANNKRNDKRVRWKEDIVEEVVYFIQEN